MRDTLSTETHTISVFCAVWIWQSTGRLYGRAEYCILKFSTHQRVAAQRFQRSVFSTHSPMVHLDWQQELESAPGKGHIRCRGDVSE